MIHRPSLRRATAQRATAARGGRDLYAAPLPPRVVILLGSETHGVSPAAARLADESIQIPGTTVASAQKSSETIGWGPRTSGKTAVQ